ncbi:hypothetical protein GR28A_00169 [Vibrio phage vB_VcorM_GR28A]|nr:hypothetical protein GR28A_00169 [Vibrio phage vB_VcorM_GR28A]
MTVANNAFEIERRVVLLKPTTTMPDNTQLGYDGNPNAVETDTALQTAGEFLIYNAPQGTFYMESDGELHRKKEGGAGGAWVLAGSGAGSDDNLISFEDGKTQWRLALVNNEMRFERNDAYDGSLGEDVVQAENWVSYASVGGSLNTDALILTEPHFIGALLDDPNSASGIAFQNVLSFSPDQEMVFGSSQRQTVISTAVDTQIERAGVVKREYEIVPREYNPADEVIKTIRRDVEESDLGPDEVSELRYTGTVQTGTGVEYLRVLAVAYRCVEVINPDAEGKVNVRIQVETKDSLGVWYNIKEASLDFDGQGLKIGVGEDMNNLTPIFEHRQGDEIRVSLRPMKGQGFKIAGEMADSKDWDTGTDIVEFKPWIKQIGEQFEHFDVVDTSNAKDTIGKATNTVLDDGVNIWDEDKLHYYRAATAGQHGDARNIDLGNYNQETNVLSGVDGVFNITVTNEEDIKLWSQADRDRLEDGVEPSVYRDLDYIEIDLERALTNSIRVAQDTDLIEIQSLELDYQLLDDAYKDEYYRTTLNRKVNDVLMFENITEFEFIDSIKGSGTFYLQEGDDREYRIMYPPQPFTFQDLEADPEASSQDKARSRRILRFWFQHPVRVWGMETTPGDEDTFVPSYRVVAKPLKRERIMTEGTVLDTVLSSIGEIEYRTAVEEDLPTLHTRHKLALADHSGEWLYFAGSQRLNETYDRFVFVTEEHNTLIWDLTKSLNPKDNDQTPSGIARPDSDVLFQMGGMAGESIDKTEWWSSINPIRYMTLNSSNRRTQNVRLHVTNPNLKKFRVNLATGSEFYQAFPPNQWPNYHHELRATIGQFQNASVSLSMNVNLYITSEDDDTLAYAIPTLAIHHNGIIVNTGDSVDDLAWSENDDDGKNLVLEFIKDDVRDVWFYHVIAQTGSGGDVDLMDKVSKITPIPDDILPIRE